MCPPEQEGTQEEQDKNTIQLESTVVIPVSQMPEMSYTFTQKKKKSAAVNQSNGSFI